MELIKKYFPNLTETQIEQFGKLMDVYKEWNEQINVVSRKDIENLYLHHVLHSLAIAKVVTFEKETCIIDVGTGGGFPGIPLAILFPDASFTLIDSIQKKIKVVSEVIKALKLKNARALPVNSSAHKERYDFILSRAVCPLPEFVRQVTHNIHHKNKNAIANGILYLKGGDVTEEIKQFVSKCTLYNIKDFFAEEFFETKKIVHLAL